MSGPPPPRGYRFSQTPAGRHLREAAQQRRVDDGGAFATVFAHISVNDADPPPPESPPLPQQAPPPPEQTTLPPTKQAPPLPELPPEQAQPPLEQKQQCRRYPLPPHHLAQPSPQTLSPATSNSNAATPAKKDNNATTSHSRHIVSPSHHPNHAPAKKNNNAFTSHCRHLVAPTH